MEFIELIEKMGKDQIWDQQPVFCFTGDVDWASEAVLEEFMSYLDRFHLNPTVFVTHASQVLDHYASEQRIERGIHPNFLPGSSHGEGFRTVIEKCLSFAPEAKAFRAHRIFDVTDITLLVREYGIKYDSNLVTILQPHLRPILHGCGLIRFPIFLEDGSHLHNGLGTTWSRYQPFLGGKGLKVISVHPLHFVLNSPEIGYTRTIKDRLSRNEYQNISFDFIQENRFTGRGIRDFVAEIIKFSADYPTLSLRELYERVIA